MHQKSHTMINYIDDLIGIGLPCEIHKSFQDLCELLQELGFTLSTKNSVVVLGLCA